MATRRTTSVLGASQSGETASGADSRARYLPIDTDAMEEDLDTAETNSEEDGDEIMQVEVVEEHDEADEEDDDDFEDEEETDLEENGATFIDAHEILQELLQEERGTQDTPHATQDEAQSSSTGPPAGRRILNITRQDLLRLLTQRTAFFGGAADADDDDDDSGYNSYANIRRRRRTGRRASELYPKVPSETGQQLMESGEFGVSERDARLHARQKRLAAMIMRREMGLGSRGNQKSVNKIAAQSLIPSSKADTVINYNERYYSGQFSDDGNFFFSCSQDFKVRMYDTSNPYSWRYYKTVIHPVGSWTITDASLSPDSKFLAYSSMNSMICLASTDPGDSEPQLLDFSDMGTSRRSRLGRSGFKIWSIRFSGDGREIVAGTDDHCVYVYDLETRRSILRIPGHNNDVNAVCYGDKSSPHILYSGSDDTTLKVWDRRSLRDSREAGVFIGHTEGLTYVDSKGDGRYVLSNSKDQTMKLWDLRKMVSTEKAERLDLGQYSLDYDYRYQSYDDSYYKPNPDDCSLVTFRGHKVLKTLIRCHFSPPGSTDGRYVYSGSADGQVYIYNMDATLAQKLDVKAATRASKVGTASGSLGYESEWATCVRDASWHPAAPVLAATSWVGYKDSQIWEGSCTLHTWNDGMDEDEAEPNMGQRLNAFLKSEPIHSASRMQRYGIRSRQWDDE